MNYAASISARLGVDTKPFTVGMNQAAADGARAGDKIAQGTNRVTVAHNHLLGSSKKVSHQISNVARSFVSGAGAGGLFATTLEAVGRSMKLSLGWLAGLFVGGVLVEEISEAAKEAGKLRAEVAALTAPGPSAKFETLDKLVSKLEEVRKVREKVKAQGFLSGVGAGFRELFSGKNDDIDENGQWKKDHNLPDNRKTGGLQREAERLMRGIADKAKRENDAQSVRDGGDSYKADRMKAYDEAMPKVQAAFFNHNMALAAEELRAYALTIRALNEKAADAGRITLEDLAARGINDTWRGKSVSIDGQRHGVKDVAQRALEEKAAYETEFASGRDPDAYHGMNYHRDRYDRFVGGMSDIVKSGDVKALDIKGAALDVLRAIEKNTERPFAHK